MPSEDAYIDCVEARRRIKKIRLNRRSQSPRDLQRAAEALGYEADRARGKGSHVWMKKAGSHPFPIPTTISVNLTTHILRILEEELENVCS